MSSDDLAVDVDQTWKRRHQVADRRKDKRHDGRRRWQSRVTCLSCNNANDFISRIISINLIQS